MPGSAVPKLYDLNPVPLPPCAALSSSVKRE